MMATPRPPFFLFDSAEPEYVYVFDGAITGILEPPEFQEPGPHELFDSTGRTAELAALDRFVAGGPELARRYEDFYWPYFNDVDPDSLGTREADLLDAVAERMDFTDDRPDTAALTDARARQNSELGWRASSPPWTGGATP